MIRRTRPGVLVLGVLLSISIALISVGLLEMAGRQLWRAQYLNLLESQLHGYDQVDRERAVIVLTPGAIVTARSFRAGMIANNKPLGVRSFDEWATARGVGDDVELFRVNSLGFKGPEIAIPKPQGTFRILTIGDSCTFLPVADQIGYPRILESRLRQFTSGSIKVEVVNVGVPGYNIESVQKRLDEFLKVEPDLITIYIGWNRTISRGDPRRNDNLYRRFALYRFAYHLPGVIRSRFGGADFTSRKTYETDGADVESWSSVSFTNELHDLRGMIGAIRGRYPNVHIVLVTLAGVFDQAVPPTEKAISMAYPTEFTPNLYAWPYLTARFNQEVRSLARDTGVGLADFERWMRERGTDRVAYFSDSVHFSEGGAQAMGEFLADEIKPYLQPEAEETGRSYPAARKPAP